MDGIVEYYGASHSLSAIIIGGWIDLTWTDSFDRRVVVISTLDREVQTSGYICIYQRDDLKKVGYGFVMILDCEVDSLQHVRCIQVPDNIKEYVIPAADLCKLCSEKELMDRTHYVLTLIAPGAHRDRLSAMVSRPTYSGSDTFSTLKVPFELRFDAIYYCPPSGLLLVGWVADPFNRLAKLSIVGEGVARVLNHRQWLPVDRPDVVTAFATRYELASASCGFVAYVANVYRPGGEVYLQVDFIDGSVAYSPLNPTFRSGMQSIKAVLSGLTFPPGSLNAAFDHVLGPAISQMNAHRLGVNLNVNVLQLGSAPTQSRCAVVIPLYGRIDFMEYQLGRFVTHLGTEDEIVYVLDEPSRRAEAVAIARSCYAKFKISFKLIILDRNVGFGPASNIGVRYSSSQYVCFLNSDVFPITERWLDELVETLVSNPAIGIVGPDLIYEDGTLQHRGCMLRPMEEYDSWWFPMHPGKGLRGLRGEEKIECEVITGACMVASRRLLNDVGSFDEEYIVGDFEDADLCFKIKDKRKLCVVDRSVILYHLERQSQALEAGSWRHNVTLYNAWVFQRRWNDTLAGYLEPARGHLYDGEARVIVERC